MHYFMAGYINPHWHLVIYGAAVGSRAEPVLLHM